MTENAVTSDCSWSKWINELVTGSHIFTVTEYSLAKGLGPGKYKSSDSFNVGGYDWIVYFYPDGLNPDDLAVCVSLFVTVDSEETEVRACFEATLMDQSGKGNHIVLQHHGSAYTFENMPSMCGFDRFCTRDELESSDYLKNDSLEIKCTVKMITERLEMPKRVYIEVPPSNMGDELKYLLDSGFEADITISVGVEKFKAHKLILSARSSFFKSQFVENPNLNEVEIVDIEPALFKLMLQYIYSSDLPNRSEFTNTMHHLLAAAICFGLNRLRLFCESKLGEGISVDNVATTLCLAEQHQCLQLKALCLKFVLANLRAVLKSKGFEDLKKRVDRNSILGL